MKTCANKRTLLEKTVAHSEIEPVTFGPISWRSANWPIYVDASNKI